MNDNTIAISVKGVKKAFKEDETLSKKSEVIIDRKKIKLGKRTFILFPNFIWYLLPFKEDFIHSFNIFFDQGFCLISKA